MSKKVSIIIPVYNIIGIKHSFKKAIHSLEVQTYSNVEIILVNDGSKDESLQYLYKLGNKNLKIRVINKENGGVESARREGLKVATGDYILHMDQDDLYRKDAIELMIKCATKNNADVVVANSKRFAFSSFLNFGKGYFSKREVCSHEDFMSKYYKGFFGVNIFPVNIWNKLYKKEFLDNIPNPPLIGFYNEDLSYNMHVLPYAKKIVLLNEDLYFYRWGGFTNRRINKFLEVALNCYDIKIKQIESLGLHQYLISSSIELLNYLNTYFYQLIEYDKLNSQDFQMQVKYVLNLENVKNAIKSVEEFDKYHLNAVDYFINSDVIGLEEFERANYKKNKVKRFLRRILFFCNY